MMLIMLGIIIMLGMLNVLSDRDSHIERKLDLLLRHYSLDPNQNPPLSERVWELARDPSRKIEAIKAYREETGCGLAEAKKAVEAFIRDHSS